MKALLLSSIAALALQEPSPEQAPFAHGSQVQAAAAPSDVNSASALLLASIESRAVEGLFDWQPWLARERGVAGTRLDLGHYGPAGERWWRRYLLDLKNGLLGLRLAQLAPKERPRLAWLQAWLRAHTILATTRSPERRDPLAYVRRVDGVLRALAQADAGEGFGRGVALGRVLSELPELWATARAGLLSPSAEFADEAAQRARDLVTFMHTGLRSSFGDARMHDTLATATDATLEFAKWLDDTQSASARTHAMGPSSWEAVVRDISGSSLSLARLKARLLRDLVVLERVRGDDVQPRVPLDALGVAELIRQGTVGAARLAAKAGLCELSDGLGGRFEAHVVTSDGMANLAVRLHSGRGRRYRLDVELEGPKWPASMAEARRKQLTESAQRLLGMRYGRTGEVLLRERARASSSRAMQFLWNRATIEGWGLYSIDALLRVDWVDNPLAKDQGLRQAFVRAKELEATRLLAALEVHAGGVSFEDAIRSFARRSYLDQASARTEVLAAMHDPLFGIGYLGYLELRDLEHELAADSTVEKAIRELFDVLPERRSPRSTDVREDLFSR